jgi:hypothetical protein
MPLSPEDLLIFKVRAANAKKEAPPAVFAGQARAQPQPPSPAPVKPVVEQAVRPPPPPPQPPPQPERPIVIERPVQPPPQPVRPVMEEVRPMPQPPQARPVMEQARPMPQPPPRPVVQVAQPVPVTFQAERVRPTVEVPVAEKLPPQAAKNKAASMAAAKGQFCAWHAWRPAYAVCNYCHRPFCYEDVEEYNNGYYCLEDIDRVSATHAENVYTSYSNMSFVAAGMLLLSFMIFMLFANAQLAYVINTARAIGVSTFVSSLNTSYEFLLVEFLLAVVSLVSAAMIFMQSKRAYSIGMVACIGDIVLFSYLFLGSGTIYIAAIAVVAFIGMITLSYSRVSYVANEETPFAEAPMLISGAAVQKF